MTVSALEHRQETIGHRVRRLARDGLGHEDIVVLLRADGLKISPQGEKLIRDIALKRTTAPLRGC